MADIQCVLREQIQRNPSLRNNESQLQAILMDLCDSTTPRWQINVIAMAQRYGIPRSLENAQGQDMTMLVLRLVQKLADDAGVAIDKARFAVSSWYFALFGTAIQLPSTQGAGSPSSSVPVNVTVAPSGLADYRTISEALDAVPAGSTITVKPGLYTETLWLRQPVEVIGDGNTDEIVISSDNSDCLVMDTILARVTGITFHKTSQGSFFGVNIARGCLILENCDIQSESLAGIAIQGKDTKAIIRHCRIHDCKGSGVLVSNGAEVFFEHCCIDSNLFSGIEVYGNSTRVTFRECKIEKGKQLGLAIHSGASTVLENSIISSNLSTGIKVQHRQSQLLARHCNIENNFETGIETINYAKGKVEGCRISNNKQGISIANGADLELLNCKIGPNQEENIYRNNSTVSTTGCTLVENTPETEEDNQSTFKITMNNLRKWGNASMSSLLLTAFIFQGLGLGYRIIGFIWSNQVRQLVYGKFQDWIDIIWHWG